MTNNGKPNSSDPAPHPLDIHIERITQIIDAVTAHTRDRTRQMRDRMDMVLKAIQECAESLRNDVERYQTLARELDDVIKVAAEPFDVLADKFRVQAPTVAAVSETQSATQQSATQSATQPALPAVKSPFDKKPLDMTLSPETDTILAKFRKDVR